MGRNQWWSSKLFPVAGQNVQETLGCLALVYFYFMIGVQQDPMAIKAPGRKGVVIALVGFLVPFLVCFSIARLTIRVVLRETIFFIFLSLFCSNSSFPVLATVISELKLLNSDLGKMAVSASMINDILAMCIKLVEQALWQRFMYKIKNMILVQAIFLFLVVFALRPLLLWIIKRRAQGAPIQHAFLLAVLGAAPLLAFTSDALGMGFTFGPLIFGLIIPSGPPLGSALIEKLETFVPGLLLPLFFTTSGLRTNLSAIAAGNFNSSFALIIFVGYIGKLVGTLLPSFLCNMSLRDSLLLALLMNTKGIVELVNINKYRAHEMLDDQSFATMLLALLIGSSIISYIVSTFYDPTSQQRNYFHRRRTIQNSEPRLGLGILTSIHSPYIVPTLINLVELTRASSEVKISLYPLHIMELKGRSVPLLVAHDANTTTTEQEPAESESLTIVKSFQNYAKQAGGGIKLFPYTAVAPFDTIYQEMCSIAENHRVSLMILPFHKEQNIGGTMEVTNPAFRAINLSILQHAPCSVGILIDRGLGGTTGESGRHVMHRVGMLFVGGADDRESLAYVAWIAEHPGVHVTVFRLLPLEENADDDESTEGLTESGKDEDILNEFRSTHVNMNQHSGRVVYEEKMVMNVEGTVGVIRHLGHSCNLIVVGRGSGKGSASSSLVAGLNEWSECPELGPIGDMLASSEFGGTASVLVMQQYTGSRRNEYSFQVGPQTQDNNATAFRMAWS